MTTGHLFPSDHVPRSNRGRRNVPPEVRLRRSVGTRHTDARLEAFGPLLGPHGDRSTSRLTLRKVFGW